MLACYGCWIGVQGETLWLDKRRAAVLHEPHRENEIGLKAVNVKNYFAISHKAFCLALSNLAIG